MNLETLCFSYLSFIKIHIESKNPDSTLIRSFVDRWFAYHQKGNFLTKNLIERKFNKPFANKLSNAERDCLLKMHFVSKDALHAILNKTNTQLIKDHSVPIKIIHKLLKKQGNCSEIHIEEQLLNFYSLGVLTTKEDLKLNALKLKSEMPNDWDGKDLFARYKKANIQQAIF